MKLVNHKNVSIRLAFLFKGREFSEGIFHKNLSKKSCGKNDSSTPELNNSPEQETGKKSVDGNIFRIYHRSGLVDIHERICIIFAMNVFKINQSSF